MYNELDKYEGITLDNEDIFDHSQFEEGMPEEELAELTTTSHE